MKLSRWPCLLEWSFYLSMRSSRSSRTNDIRAMGRGAGRGGWFALLRERCMGSSLVHIDLEAAIAECLLNGATLAKQISQELS